MKGEKGGKGVIRLRRWLPGYVGNYAEVNAEARIAIVEGKD